MTLKERFSKYCDNVYQDKEVNAEFCEEIADDFAIGFAEWVECSKTYYTPMIDLLEIYKREKGL